MARAISAEGESLIVVYWQKNGEVEYLRSFLTSKVISWSDLKQERGEDWSWTCLLGRESGEIKLFVGLVWNFGQRKNVPLKESEYLLFKKVGVKLRKKGGKLKKYTSDNLTHQSAC